jgi:hypothetical protein
MDRQSERKEREEKEGGEEAAAAGATGNGPLFVVEGGCQPMT